MDEMKRVEAGSGPSSSPTDDQLRAGARDFEMFWLRPRRYAGKDAMVRLMLTGKLGGWKLKDELVESLGMAVGDCINVEVDVLMGPGIIDDNGDTDLFADGEQAEWLIDAVMGAGSAVGTTIDCKVRFVYDSVPVGMGSKMVSKISLVLLEGYRIVSIDDALDGLDELPPMLMS